MSDAPTRFEDFSRERYGQLFAALCLTTGSRQEAEEIAQEAFVRVLERWDRVVELENPGGYAHNGWKHMRVEVPVRPGPARCHQRFTYRSNPPLVHRGEADD